MNDILRIARLRIALQRAFLGRAILIFTPQAVTFLHNACTYRFLDKAVQLKYSIDIVLNKFTKQRLTKKFGIMKVHCKICHFPPDVKNV